MSPLEIDDAHLALTDVGTHADHLERSNDAVIAFAVLVARDEVLDVVEPVELVAHLLFDLRADGGQIVGEDDILGFDKLLAAVDGAVECLDFALLGCITEGQTFLIIFIGIDEDEAVERSLLLIEAQAATNLRKFEFRLVGPKHDAALLGFGLNEQVEEVAVIAVIAEVPQLTIVVEWTHGGHAWAGKTVVVVEETADMGLWRVGDLDAEQVGRTKVDEQGRTGIAQICHLHTTHENLLAEGGTVHLPDAVVKMPDQLFGFGGRKVFEHLLDDDWILLAEALNDVLHEEELQTVLLEHEFHQFPFVEDLTMDGGVVFGFEVDDVGAEVTASVAFVTRNDFALLSFVVEQAIAQGEQE